MALTPIERLTTNFAKENEELKKIIDLKDKINQSKDNIIDAKTDSIGALTAENSELARQVNALTSELEALKDSAKQCSFCDGSSTGKLVSFCIGCKAS